MAVKWTADQQKVITLRNRNLLVSAAAGSGKTAVLVERIIQMLTDEAAPIDVDRLLIVTFTEAAASEMKERIRSAIERKLTDNPENVHLQRQSTLIYSALITTIHSFCLSVIRDHFHAIDLDPGFRIVEQGELKLLKQDVLDELLEQQYAAEDNLAFLEFVEKFGTGRNDKKIEGLILKLFEYSQSYPQPELWLMECAANYQIDADDSQTNTGNSSNKGFISIVQNHVQVYLKDALALLKQGMAICDEPDGPYMYYEMLEADYQAIENVLDKEGFSALGEAVCSIAYQTLSRKKDESVSADKREQVKILRDQMKKLVNDLKAEYFYDEESGIRKDMLESHGVMQVIVRLVTAFAREFNRQKRSKNMIDFNDMEHLALQILTEERNGQLVPSAVAREYQEQFTEVMIDEYQDSNLIQETILTSVSKVSRGQYNVFMVGDVKQSIYRFRLSRPELFMEKYDSYSLEDSDRQRIDLHKNFRSRNEVLTSANYVFEQIMRREVGGITYDEKAALYPGADYEEQTDGDGRSINRAELFLCEPTRESEAAAIIWRIKELLKNGRVLDKETGEYRQVRYRDIVILLRTTKGWAEEFSTLLKDAGIPTYAGSREGYFEAYEVSVLLDYLRILNNRRQDIPLAAVLTSSFVGLNAKQMAMIKNAYPDWPFYEAVIRYSEDGAASVDKDEQLQERLRRFWLEYESYREMLPYIGIHDLLWHIIEHTGYGLYVQAMPGGSQRKANVDMLIEKAAAYEGTSYKGVFNFIRYIELLKKYEVDFGEANISDEQSDTVRIMSIHKSKGLEFPIVIVAGMGKQFNTQDLNDSLVIHPSLGVGIDCVDLEKRTKISTLLKKVIKEELILDNLGEELRVLYVALTRAKEKLIMVGQLKDAEEVWEKYQEGHQANHSADTGLPFYQIAKAKSYLDWMLPAVADLPDGIPMDVSVFCNQDAETTRQIETQAEILAKDVLIHWNVNQIYDSELKENLNQQLQFRYSYQEEEKLKLKFTVSELKKRAYLNEESGEELYKEPEVIPLLPRFLQEETKLTGASRGTAYHRFLELLDFAEQYSLERLTEKAETFCSTGKLSQDMVDSIDVKDILGFLNTNSGKRMSQAAAAGKLFEEQPFVLGVDAADIYPIESGRETVLVQGIIDVWFEEEDGLVVLDYKTDKARSAKDLVEKYHAQLDYYAKALEQLTGKHVKEKVIYSFTLGQEIQVDRQFQASGS